jgi:trehalose utilization protein
MSAKLQVTVWGENVHEQKHQLVRDIYPQGMHQCIADALNEDPGISARTATLQQPEHGLTEEVLAGTDVLTWWGHAAHAEVDDRIVARVQERVWQGMGLVALHSSHHSKIFEALMGTTCNLLWREAGELERVWVINPGHPIAQGLGPYFEIEQEEMYGEPFGIPTPDEQIFISWFKGGEVFRSGCTWKRGNGKIVYFRPGHETYPTYHHPQVRQVIKNAVRWARPEGSLWQHLTLNIPADKAPEPLVVKGGSVHDDSGHIA